MSGRPTDRRCVVTGASSGIGRAVAIALAAAPASHIYTVGRRRERLNALAANLAEPHGKVTPVAVDLAQDESIVRAVELILAEQDGVDVLVHSAGTIELGTGDEMTVAQLDRQYAVNLRAAVSLTLGLLPALRRAHGQIVFVNSSAALRASASNSLYAATKAGLRAFADGLRDQVNEDGVRVLTAYVGRTATPMQESLYEVEGRPYRPESLLQPADVAGMVLDMLALPRTAEVTDVNIRPMQKSLDA